MGGVFSRNFDREAAEAVQRQVREAARRFDDADLDRAAAAAREAGFEAGRAEGHAAGRAEALAEIEARSAAALEAALPALTDILGQIAMHQSALEDHLRRFALQVCEAAFPIALDRLGPAQVAREIDRLCADVLTDGHLVVTLAPETSRQIGARLRTAAQEHGHHLEIREDPDLDATAFRAAWKDGFAEGALRKTCAAILETLRRAGNDAGSAPLTQETSDD